MTNKDEHVFYISFLTLNCWGIPSYAPLLGSSDRIERIRAIAEFLSDPRNNLDVVCLQEVWSVDDFELIKNRCSSVLKYAHRFTSGIIGSGVVVLSKYRIDDLLTYRFSVNGYAHHVHRGDWYGGKVVGLARIHVPELKKPVNIYGTHVHAEYDRISDIYLAHRVVQAVEVAQFVRLTSRDDEFAFLLGDLNLESTDLGCRIINNVALMRDAWVCGNTAATVGLDEATCERPDNCYTPRKGARPKRIDYITFKAVKNFSIDVAERRIDMNHVATRPGLNFSDHVAIRTKFSIKKSDNDETMLSPAQILTARECLREATVVVNEGIDKSRYNRYFFGIVAALVFIAYLVILYMSAFSPAESVRIGTCMVVSFILALIFGFYVWHGAIVLKSEENALLEAKEEIDILYQSMNLRD